MQRTAEDPVVVLEQTVRNLDTWARSTNDWIVQAQAWIKDADKRLNRIDPPKPHLRYEPPPQDPKPYPPK